MSSGSAGFVPWLGTPLRAGFEPFGAAAEGPEPLEAGAAGVGERAASEEVQRAFESGLALGRDEAASRVEQAAESLVKSLENLGAFRHELESRYANELLAVAVAVARQIVRRELEQDPAAWIGMLRAAVRRLVDRERVVVRVPAPLAAYLRGLPELRAALDEVKAIEVVEDAALEDGGCVIESSFGEVDLGVETQLAAAAHALACGEET